MKKLKIKNKKVHYCKGMTYVELIVVLSIYAIMTSVVIYNYGAFQDKVNTKNLASDIALKVVEAQKSALSGLFPPAAQQTLIPNLTTTWKPSYGVYINPVIDNTSFLYFVDTDQNGLLDNTNCSIIDECLEKNSLTQGDTISGTNNTSGLNVFYSGDANPHALNDLTVTFTRPNSGAIFKSSTPFTAAISYVQVTVTSPKFFSVNIEIYPSGRIQVD